VNHRLHRIYREAGLMIQVKKRKHCVREGKPLVSKLKEEPSYWLPNQHAVHLWQTGSERTVPRYDRQLRTQGSAFRQSKLARQAANRQERDLPLPQQLLDARRNTARPGSKREMRRI
jgi:hypothetical protein